MDDIREYESRGADQLRSDPGQVQVDTCADDVPSTHADADLLDSRAAPTQVLHDDPTKPKTAGGGASTEAASKRGGMPEQIGRFHCVRELGRGAFGVVLQVWDPELHTHRAIKMPHRQLLASGRMDAASYVSEARKVAQLGKHPAIVEVLDVQRLEDGVPYVVSEYIAGGSLSERLRRSGRMPWREAAELVAQIADAIAHAHSKGIVHRDLKPGNILLDEQGRPMVVDFGLALDESEFSYQSSICGTYHYMSPQQVLGGSNRVDGRSDIYSLGVILYQLLAGRVPYKSQSVEHIKREILEEEPTPLRQYNAEVPPALEAVCRKAMAKEPADRFSTAGDFAQALRAAIQPVEKHTLAAKPVAEGPKRWLPLVVSTTLFLVVAAGLFAFFGRRPDVTLSGGSAVGATTPDLSIHFQKSGEAVFDRNLSQGDLPLAAGDKIQFHAKLPAPMYAYLYWVDSEGEPKRVWPRPDMPLDAQQPVTELSSPPGAENESLSTWWEIPQTGGPQVFFLGVADQPLGEQQLGEFEQQTAFMRKLLPGDALVAEFEYPEQPSLYRLTPEGPFRTRGADLVAVVSPKKYASDHSMLQRWFQAYHGWIVATEP